MAETAQAHLALGDVAARKLANATKTAPTLLSISPRWLVHLLPWVGVEAGIYRVNKVKDESRVLTACSHVEDERDLPETFVDYDEAAREYYLSSVTTVVDVHTRVSDLYSHPYDQIKQQLRLAIETIKERQESEILHNRDYGILTNVAPAQRITTLAGPPTPDDLDKLITLVWKEPAFFFGASAGDRGVRARGDAAGCPAGDGESVRFAGDHVARDSDRAQQQAQGRWQHEPDPAAAHR